MFTLEQIKENRRKWVEALRSGKYRQITSQLRFGAGMCCLGVLADISGCGWRKVDGEWHSGGEWRIAPEKAMDFVGLRTNNGEIADPDVTLGEENDGGASFAIIADIIEQEPAGLFLTDEEITASLNTGKEQPS